MVNRRDTAGRNGETRTLQTPVLPLELTEKLFRCAFAVCTGRVQLVMTMALKHLKHLAGSFYGIDVRRSSSICTYPVSIMKSNERME